MSTQRHSPPVGGESDDEDRQAADRAFLESLPRRLQIVDARSPLTRDGLPDRTDCGKDPELGAAAQQVWDAEKASARALAGRYRALAELFDHEREDDEDEDDVTTARAAIALRVTHGVARWELRSAHRAAHHLPRTFTLLEGGAFPSWWFQRMVRESEDLGEESRRQLDIAVATWSPDIPVDRFVTLLGALVGLLARREEEPETAPPPPREVTIAPDSPRGVGSVSARGPIPEILEYWKRLDESARAIQAAQRKALRDDTEIPYDVDDLVTTTGRPLPLSRLRYELQLNATFDTGDVQIPGPRFRLNVTVPALTLLGVSDAPGMVDGTTPIPPEMARLLAGGQETWFRVLTDPCSGAFLPLPAERYQPTQAMREHLRLRNATCAVPGCTRPVSWASECDHLEEFDHERPVDGGRTELENLHLLCWQHHQDKTAGLLDPTRIPTVAREPGRTSWRIGRSGDHALVADDVDLATRIAVEELENAWRTHLSRLKRSSAEKTAEKTAEKSGKKSAEKKTLPMPPAEPPSEPPWSRWPESRTRPPPL
ncbi:MULTISPECIES: HNH endonuclease signature motif containing protein [unclassified Brachybacterium]|uniref:HNH endonuclease signature motif containing protein n=1 Tax=unclassified Brachybacterium TaxID=2623841 RepID=UPI0040349719